MKPVRYNELRNSLPNELRAELRNLENVLVRKLENVRRGSPTREQFDDFCELLRSVVNDAQYPL